MGWIGTVAADLTEQKTLLGLTHVSGSLGRNEHT